MAALARARLLRSGHRVLEFPSWDCLPYDRSSPHAGVVAQRMTALSRLARLKGQDRPSVVLTTVNAALQRVPARDLVAQALAVTPGNVLDMQGIIPLARAQRLCPHRDVRSRDYAVRGGIIDLYAPGMAEPVRLDFFGDTLESIRASIPKASAPPTSCMRSIWFGRRVPAHHRDHPAFPAGLCGSLRAPSPDDLLYQAVSEGAATSAWSIGCRCSRQARHDFDYLPAPPWRSSRGSTTWRASARADQGLLRSPPAGAGQRGPARPIIGCRPIGFICRNQNGAIGSPRHGWRGSRRLRCRRAGTGRGR